MTLAITIPVRGPEDDETAGRQLRALQDRLRVGQCIILAPKGRGRRLTGKVSSLTRLHEHRVAAELLEVAVAQAVRVAGGWLIPAGEEATLIESLTTEMDSLRLRLPLHRRRRT